MHLSFRKKILLVSLLVSMAFFATVYIYMSNRYERMYMETTRHQARLLFNNVVLMRRWVADHGGIFVEKLPWVGANPYLKNSELAVGDKHYVKQNPARVTRELSEYARTDGTYWFHITSKRLVNPANAPDPFELKALEAFEAKEAEDAWEVSKIEGKKYFRFIAPLYIKAECLECHQVHGYKLGDVRGAISVTLPLSPLYSMLWQEKLYMGGLALAMSLLMTVSLYVMLERVIVRRIRMLRDFAVAWHSQTPGEEPAGGCAEDTLKMPEWLGAMGRSVLPGSPEDEIGELYCELSLLHKKLTEYQTGLEGRIKEATRELMDINEQLTYAMRRYREASLRKSEFIAGLSHELRTPLTSTKGAMSYLRKRFSGMNEAEMAEVAPFMEIVERNIDRFIRLVEDTLDLEKIEAGQLDFHFTEVDIAHLVAEAVSEYSSSGNAALTFNTHIQCEGMMVKADADRVRQVMNNLLTNAIKHSPPGSALDVDAYASGNWLIVRVRDRGPGISVDMRRKVFERYYKGAIKGGTGLGLTISKGIIDSHGGQIGIESPEEGTGTVFYFKLPLAHDHKEAQQEAAAAGRRPDNLDEGGGAL